LISGLRPPILDEFGVVTAIEGLIAETETSGERDIEFQHDIQRDRLEPVLENSIYRVVQESLSNACRHSQSPRILVRLVQLEDRIQIRVQDGGLGFDPVSVDQSRYGLAGIRERARLLGGHVSINSRPGEGTTVDVELPADVKDLPD
jgi:signal transduction histidine kinase